jgi:hypothetical protein
MPITLSPVGGDGVSCALIRLNVQLPDSGTTANVQGCYQVPAIGQAQQTPQPLLTFNQNLTSPGVPGSGSNYFLAQVNTTTGAVTSLTGTVPQTASAGNVALFQQTIPSGSPTAISQQGGFVFSWLGTVCPI